VLQLSKATFQLSMVIDRCFCDSRYDFDMRAFMESCDASHVEDEDEVYAPPNPELGGTIFFNGCTKTRVVFL
jgi:hypothetical protein